MTTAEKMESARSFPDNTCPASRHAQLLAESLLACKKPRWSIDEPNHCGESIAAVVTWLYQARDRIAELDGLLDRVVRNRDMWKGQCERQAEQLTEQKSVTCKEVEQKRNMQEQEQEPVAHLWQHGETGRTTVRMPDEVFTAGPSWQHVGPLCLQPLKASQPESVGEWKDHDTAKLVNELRDIAVTYAGAQQLRERIAHAVRPLTDKLDAQKGTT